MTEITDRIRYLRKNPTKAEKILWEAIRGKKLGKKFRRQHPIIFYINDKKRYFIADFLNTDNKLIIELDGKIHENQRISYSLIPSPCRRGRWLADLCRACRGKASRMGAIIYNS